MGLARSRPEVLRNGFAMTEKACRLRVEDAKLMGWEALAQSWQKSLDNLLAKRAQPKEKNP